MLLYRIDDINRFIDELKYHNPEFGLYEEDLKGIFESLLIKNSKVFFNSISDRCMMNPPNKYEPYYYLNFGIKGYKKTVFIIYSILHELGHLLDTVTPITDKRQREIKAWELAEEQMNFYPSIINEENFIEHRDACLASYGIRI